MGCGDSKAVEVKSPTSVPIVDNAINDALARKKLEEEEAALALAARKKLDEEEAAAALALTKADNKELKVTDVTKSKQPQYCCMEGYMKKKSPAIMAAWQRRYCVLDKDSVFSYYALVRSLYFNLEFQYYYIMYIYCRILMLRIKLKQKVHLIFKQ